MQLIKYYTISFIFFILYIIQIIQAENIENNSISENDDYYIIVVNNTLANIDIPNKKKRQPQNFNSNIEDIFVSSIVDDIQNIIIDNKDTYKNITKFEEIELKNHNLFKRNNVVYSNLVYPVVTIKERTFLYAYLSYKLIGKIKSIYGVKSCTPDIVFEKNAHYDNNEIYDDTKWKSTVVRKNASLHLSLISQGKYDDTLIDEYDTNYYFPSSAGKDVDIFILDEGFNFNDKEFNNKKNRNVICDLAVESGITTNATGNPDLCNPYEKHGSMVADVAGGVTKGVAKLANIHGIYLSNFSILNVVTALKYIHTYLFRPYKAIFNFSFGIFTPSFKLKEDIYITLQELITEISNDGAIFIASAGNDGKNVHDDILNEHYYPGTFDNIIAVGGINNNIMEKNNTIISYEKAPKSNFGKDVDIYAPYYASVSYTIKDRASYSSKAGGTSFSAPIVAGVAALVMSENPSVKFTTNSMLKYLTKIGEKDIVEGVDKPNVFINNGKHIVYSQNEVYYGCGVHSGNKKCSSNKCCTRDGHCSLNKDSCTTLQGCQVNYGICEVVYTSNSKMKCGFGYGSCPTDYCCSYKGYCGKSSDYCKVGCQKDYGQCK